MSGLVQMKKGIAVPYAEKPLKVGMKIKEESLGGPCLCVVIPRKSAEASRLLKSLGRKRSAIERQGTRVFLIYPWRKAIPAMELAGHGLGDLPLLTMELRELLDLYFWFAHDSGADAPREWMIPDSSVFLYPSAFLLDGGRLAHSTADTVVSLERVLIDWLPDTDLVSGVVPEDYENAAWYRGVSHSN